MIDAPDFYPVVPSADQLLAVRAPQAIRRLDAGIVAPYMLQTGAGVERQLPKTVVVAVNYLYSRGSHMPRFRSVPALAGGVVRPSAIYLYEVSGLFKQDELITSVNAKVNSRLLFTSSYTFGQAHSDTDGVGTFPADSNDLRPEYGRAGFDLRHRFQFSGSWAAPWGVRLSPLFVASSSRPFNIIVGQDLNGDTLFTDRPAFATDLGRSTVRHAEYGTFDSAPIAGQMLIPRNYGTSPGMVALNLRLTKTLKLGKEAKGRRYPMESTFTAVVSQPV